MLAGIGNFPAGSAMAQLKYIVQGVTMAVCAVALTACIGMHRVNTEGDVASAALMLHTQLDDTALRLPSVPRAVPPSTPANPQSRFQVCRLDSVSCLALDPRPFVVCPAAGDSVCAATGSFEPLRAGQQLAEPPTGIERR